MKKINYEVLAGFWFHSKRYDQGDPIELTPREARNLLRAGKVGPVAEAKAKPAPKEKNPPRPAATPPVEGNKEKNPPRRPGTPPAEGTEKLKTETKKEGKKQ